jgi:hypothetical protein
MKTARELTVADVGGWCTARGLAYRSANKRGLDPHVTLPGTHLGASFRVPQDAYSLAMLVVFLAKWFRPREALVLPTVRDITNPRYRVAVVRALGGWPPGWLLPRDEVSARHFVGEWLGMLMSLNYQAVFVEEDADATMHVGDDIVEIYCHNSGRNVRLRRTLWNLDARGLYGEGREGFLPRGPDNNEMNPAKRDVLL